MQRDAPNSSIARHPGVQSQCPLCKASKHHASVGNQLGSIELSGLLFEEFEDLQGHINDSMIKLY